MRGTPQDAYYPSWDAAPIVGLDKRVLGRITSSVWVSDGGWPALARVAPNRKPAHCFSGKEDCRAIILCDVLFGLLLLQAYCAFCALATSQEHSTHYQRAADRCPPPRRPAGDNRVDVGLSVKNGKTNMCVPGYCVKLPVRREGQPPQWGFSAALLEVLRRYRQHAPWLFDGLANAKDDAGERTCMYLQIVARYTRARSLCTLVWLSTSAFSRQAHS